MRTGARVVVAAYLAFGLLLVRVATLESPVHPDQIIACVGLLGIITLLCVEINEEGWW